MNTPLQAAARTTRRMLVLALAIALLALPASETPAAADMAASRDATLATSAWAWGSNYDGQIGDDSSGYSALPVPVRDSSGAGRLGNIVAVAATNGTCWDACNSRSGHSLALDREGYVWEWGDAPNEPGTALRPFPAPVLLSAGGPRLGGIAAIAAGSGFSLALDRDGTVWAWGTNYSGQLGQRDFSIASSPWPLRVLDLSGTEPLRHIVAIAAGEGHALALGRDGEVWAWGSNSEGQLGDGSTKQSRLPTWVRNASNSASLKDIVGIAASAVHSVALDRTGRLWAWGLNSEGELGDGTTVNRLLPVRVLDATGSAPLGRIAAIAAGGRQALAIDADGHVWQIGRASQLFPRLVRDATGAGPLGDIVAVSVGGSRYVLATDRAGQVWDLRAGYPSDTLPVLVPDHTGTGPLRDVSAVAAGMYHALVLGRDGKVWAWGDNGVGQLGVSPPPFYVGPVLVRSAGGTGFDAPVSIAAGAQRSLAVDRAGRVWDWGNSAHEGWFGGVRHPTLVVQQAAKVPLSGIVAVAAGSTHGLALDADGVVWAWGDDSSGQLGDGPGSPDLCTAYDQWPCSIGAVPLIGLPPIASLAAGRSLSLALDRSGRVWAWGSGYAGALGTGDTAGRESPVRLPGLANIVAVAVGSTHSLTLAADGAVWAWGSDASGQVGDGTSLAGCGSDQRASPCATRPVRLSAPTEVVAIAAGEAHSLAVLADGTVAAWGRDDAGQLGDGPGAPDSCAIDRQIVPCATSPVAVAGLSGVTAIAGGGAHSLALDRQGHAWAWGSNSRGQLGDGTVINRDAPVPVLDRESGVPLADVVAIAAGSTHSLALRATDPALERCFPQSGSCLRGSFLAYWREHGGLALNGFPLTGELTDTLEDGKQYTVQYFERVRLELHPENAPPHGVLLGQFGRRILAGIPGAPTAPVTAREGYAYFASTGHNVRPAFYTFWDGNGGLAQFGLPLSEEFVETLEDGQPYTVQYFERARFEWHPDNAGTPYDVLLGQFGRRIYDER